MNFFTRVRFGIQTIERLTLLRTLQYEIYRAWVEFRFGNRGLINRVTAPGKLELLDQTVNGIQLRFGAFELTITFLTDDLVQILWTPGESPVPYAIAQQEWEPVKIEIEAEHERISLRSSDLEIKVFQDGGLEFASPDGALLQKQEPPTRRGARWIQKSPLHPDERIFGLGERAAPFNLRPGEYRMWNEDPGGSYEPGADPLYMGIPTYLGLHSHGSYLIFFENSFPAKFSFGETAAVQFDNGALQYYIIPGPPDRALDRYTQLTGRPLMPPRWVLGYHQSRWGYKDEKAVQLVVDGFERHDLPLDVIHLDIDYMDGYRVFTVDKKRFPDLSRLVRDLKKRDIEVVPILDCGVKKDKRYRTYQQGLDLGMFCKLPDGKPVSALVWPGWSAFPDFTNPEARAWWGGEYQRLLSTGVGGIWHDMNEPAAFSAWGLPTLPLVTRHHMEGRGGDHLEGHNLYGLLMARSGHEALHKYRPEKRPWLLTRSGWAGIQRYAWHWTGDTETSWEMMRHTLHALLGLGLSGVPFSGADIGGFSGSPSPELFLRWFQFAAFTPFFRNHAALPTPPREPWQFGTDILKILRAFLFLRRQLIPYLYTHTWQASQTGAPLMRPLFWSHFKDESLWDISDVYLLGPNLLVAPVFEEGVVKREISLPPGQWVNYWDNTVQSGGQTIEVDIYWETIPLFVRMGAILPLQAAVGIQLKVYPPAAGSDESFLYSDAGDGNGPSRYDRFRVQTEGSYIIIRWDQLSSDFLFPYPSVTIEIMGPEVDKAWVDNEPLQVEENRISVGYFEEIRFHKSSA